MHVVWTFYRGTDNYTASIVNVDLRLDMFHAGGYKHVHVRAKITQTDCPCTCVAGGELEGRLHDRLATKQDIVDIDQRWLQHMGQLF